MSYRLPPKEKDRLQSETGTFVSCNTSDLSIVLIYPNTYSVAMSNLGFQVVYRLLNEMEGVSCERAFLPVREDIKDF